jgi:hypothetical protein
LLGWLHDHGTPALLCSMQAALQQDFSAPSYAAAQGTLCSGTVCTATWTTINSSSCSGGGGLRAGCGFHQIRKQRQRMTTHQGA